MGSDWCPTHRRCCCDRQHDYSNLPPIERHEANVYPHQFFDWASHTYSSRGPLGDRIGPLDAAQTGGSQLKNNVQITPVSKLKKAMTMSKNVIRSEGAAL